MNCVKIQFILKYNGFVIRSNSDPKDGTNETRKTMSIARKHEPLEVETLPHFRISTMITIMTMITLITMMRVMDDDGLDDDEDGDEEEGCANMCVMMVMKMMMAMMMMPHMLNELCCREISHMLNEGR